MRIEFHRPLISTIPFSIVAECFDLGRIAYTNEDYYHTLMWMQEALDHLNREGNNTSVKKVDILDHLAYATSQVKPDIFSLI